jgi:hypothetical protein
MAAGTAIGLCIELTDHQVAIILAGSLLSLFRAHHQDTREGGEGRHIVCYSLARGRRLLRIAGCLAPIQGYPE